MRVRILVILDSILFVTLLLLFEPRFGGLAVHEWLGLAVIPFIIIHLLFAWQWIAGLPVRLGAQGAWRLRANALLNALLFVAFVVTAFSGAMTSFVALPSLGIAPGNFERWRLLHNQWEVCLEILVALHVAMNWNWIVTTLRRFMPGRASAP